MLCKIRYITDGHHVHGWIVVTYNTREFRRILWLKIEDSGVGFAMSDTLSVFDAFIDFLLSQPSLEEILAYELPDATQKHIQDLLEKQSHSALADEEKSELSNYAFYSTLITMLKAKVRLKLKKSEE